MLLKTPGKLRGDVGWDGTRTGVAALQRPLTIGVQCKENETMVKSKPSASDPRRYQGLQSCILRRLTETWSTTGFGRCSKSRLRRALKDFPDGFSDLFKTAPYLSRYAVPIAHHSVVAFFVATRTVSLKLRGWHVWTSSATIRRVGGLYISPVYVTLGTENWIHIYYFPGST